MILKQYQAIDSNISLDEPEKTRQKQVRNTLWGKREGRGMEGEGGGGRAREGGGGGGSIPIIFKRIPLYMIMKHCQHCSDLFCYILVDSTAFPGRWGESGHEHPIAQPAFQRD